MLKQLHEVQKWSKAGTGVNPVSATAAGGAGSIMHLSAKKDVRVTVR